MTIVKFVQRYDFVLTMFCPPLQIGALDVFPNLESKIRALCARSAESVRSATDGRPPSVVATNRPRWSVNSQQPNRWRFLVWHSVCVSTSGRG